MSIAQCYHTSTHIFKHVTLPHNLPIFILSQCHRLSHIDIQTLTLSRLRTGMGPSAGDLLSRLPVAYLPHNSPSKHPSTWSPTEPALPQRPRDIRSPPAGPSGALCTRTTRGRRCSPTLGVLKASRSRCCVPAWEAGLPGVRVLASGMSWNSPHWAQGSQRAVWTAALGTGGLLGLGSARGTVELEPPLGPDLSEVTQIHGPKFWKCGCHLTWPCSIAPPALFPLPSHLPVLTVKCLA